MTTLEQEGQERETMTILKQEELGTTTTLTLGAVGEQEEGVGEAPRAVAVLPVEELEEQEEQETTEEYSPGKVTAREKLWRSSYRGIKGFGVDMEQIDKNAMYL